MGRGRRTVARWTSGANRVSRVRDSRWPLPLSALICGPDRGKTPRKGVEKAIFGGICYVAHDGATPFEDYIYVYSRVPREGTVSFPRRGRIGRLTVELAWKPRPW